MPYLRNIGLFVMVSAVFIGGMAPFLGAAPLRPATQDSIKHPSSVLLDSLSVTYFLRRQQFVEQILTDLYRDTSSMGLSFTRRARLRLQIPQFSDTTTGPPVVPIDPIEEEWRKRAGRDAVLDFSQVAQAVRSLLKKKSQKPAAKPKIKDLPVPSPVELQLLTAIWEKGKATGPEVYVALDTSIHLTAEMTWKILREMARKGYLVEKQVSPKLPFTLQLPFYSVEIEMSGKNRRNRVFEYRPLVDANDLLHYLIAQRYLQQSQSPPATNGSSSLSSLDQLINIILQYRLRNM